MIKKFKIHKIFERKKRRLKDKERKKNRKRKEKENGGRHRLMEVWITFYTFACSWFITNIN